MTAEETNRFVCELGLFKMAVSLGAVESLVAHPATMTHTSLTQEEKEAVGITDNLVRISVGIEHPTDLITDIDNAMMHALGKRE